MLSEEQKQRIVDSLYGELSGEEETQLQKELEANEEMRTELSRMRSTVASLSEWKEVQVPEDLHREVMQRFHEERQGGFLDQVTQLLRALWIEARPTLAALAIAALVIWLGVGRPEVLKQNPLTLVFLGVIWGGTYNTFFRTLFCSDAQVSRGMKGMNAPRVLQIDPRAAIFMGFVAMAIALATAIVTPNPRPFEDRPGFLLVSDALPYWVAYILPGFYSLVGTFLAGLFLSRKIDRYYPTHALVMGLVYAILMELNLYTCRLLDPVSPKPMFIVWLVSALVCGVSGALTGVDVGKRFLKKGRE